MLTLQSFLNPCNLASSSTRCIHTDGHCASIGGLAVIDMRAGWVRDDIVGFGRWRLGGCRGNMLRYGGRAGGGLAVVVGRKVVGRRRRLGIFVVVGGRVHGHGIWVVLVGLLSWFAHGGCRLKFDESSSGYLKSLLVVYDTFDEWPTPGDREKRSRTGIVYFN